MIFRPPGYLICAYPVALRAALKSKNVAPLATFKTFKTGFEGFERFAVVPHF